MAQPCNTTVTIDGQKFNAHSSHFCVGTHDDQFGMPLMGASRTAISVMADIHDDVNVPFPVLKSLFELSHSHTKDKIKDIKIEFWKDEQKQSAVIVFSFRGWISNFAIIGAGNHQLSLSIQPALGKMNFLELAVGN
jgi:hypothetical protein